MPFKGGTMPTIQVSDENFARLQAAATPFVDTPDSVIGRLLDLTGSSLSFVPPSDNSAATVHAAIRSPTKIRECVVDEGDLAFTKVLSATIGSRRASKWNELLVAAHAEALGHLGSLNAIRRISQAALSDGDRKDSGYHYSPALGFSIQYVDSNKAWEYSLKIAKELRVEIDVAFMWRSREGAQRPGEDGHLHWHP